MGRSIPPCRSENAGNKVGPLSLARWTQGSPVEDLRLHRQGPASAIRRRAGDSAPYPAATFQAP